MGEVSPDACLSHFVSLSTGTQHMGRLKYHEKGCPFCSEDGKPERNYVAVSRHALLVTVPFLPEWDIVPAELSKNRDVGNATELLSSSNRTTFKQLPFS